MLFFNRRKVISQLISLQEEWLKLICKVSGLNYIHHVDSLLSEEMIDSTFDNRGLLLWKKDLKKKIKILNNELKEPNLEKGN